MGKATSVLLVKSRGHVAGLSPICSSVRRHRTEKSGSLFLSSNEIRIGFVKVGLIGLMSALVVLGHLPAEAQWDASKPRARERGVPAELHHLNGVWEGESNCDSPDLVVSVQGTQGYLFKFKDPKLGEHLLREDRPARRIAGGRLLWMFKFPSTAIDRVWFETVLSDSNSLLINFATVGTGDRSYRRCGDAPEAKK